jgi:hypothetical protein
MRGAALEAQHEHAAELQRDDAEERHVAAFDDAENSRRAKSLRKITVSAAST